MFLELSNIFFSNTMVAMQKQRKWKRQVCDHPSEVGLNPQLLPPHCSLLDLEDMPLRKCLLCARGCCVFSMKCLNH